MPSPARQRRTQEERSFETRQKLLDATVTCLLEKGYASTTTTLVAEQAGVSRGAQLHHFPRKGDLVRAAVEYVFDQRVEEFREAMARLPEGEDRLAHAIDLLWESYSARGTFYPCLEFMVAARTDVELREQLKPVLGRIVDTVQGIFRELFPDMSKSPLGEQAPLFALAVMDGLALGQMTEKNDEVVSSMLNALKQIAALLQLEGRL